MRCARPMLLLALAVALPLHAAQLAIAPQDPVAALVDAIAATQDPLVPAALARIDGTDRQLLALRSYLRNAPHLAERWSWTAGQIAAFAQSPGNQALQADIERVRQHFAQANPGYELWVNPEVRSLDTQLANWNSNESVSLAGAALSAAIRELLASPAVRAMQAPDARRAVEQFLIAYTPTPPAALAAPGLSPHGQMRAIDFQIQKGDTIVAGPRTATIATEWDAAGWTAKLKEAVQAAGNRFTGPLESPREPWHYTYVAEPRN